MKKIVLFFCLLTASFCNAQTIFIDIDNQTQNKTLEGYSFSALPEMKEIDFSKELFVSATQQIPAYGLYDQVWDTVHLRSVQFALPLGDEGLKIILVESYNSPFIYPCRGNVVLTYGQQKKTGFHTGIDFQLNPDDPVYASFDGVVRMTGNYGDYGKTVVVRHYNGLETVYAHLNKVLVKSGQILKAGHVIGLAGNTGRTDGKYSAVLHFETRFLNEYFNPILILDVENRTLNDNFILLTSRDFNITPIPPKPIIPQQPSPEVKQDIKQDIKLETESQITPADTQTTPTESTPQYHTIKPGETLYRISVQYNTSVDKLLKLNNIKSPDNIQAGQKIRVN